MFTKQLDNVVEKAYRQGFPDYIAKYLINTKVPFSSFDLRNSGFKISHVDANLFPAGFNNLSEKAVGKATDKFKVFMQAYPDIKRVMLFAENFDRNIKYFENLLVLSEIINKAGFELKIASINGFESELIKIAKAEQVIKEFSPQLIISNNDFTDGVPLELQKHNCIIVPNSNLGWFKRRKSKHFNYYKKIANEFASNFDIDPWLISAEFDVANDVDFNRQQSLDSLASQAEALLNKISIKYKDYNIKESPRVYLKSDFGTYGMGIMVIKDAQEIININKKARNKMATIKSGKVNNSIIIQEAIPTIEMLEGNPAEIMAYTVNNEVVDLFYRANTERDSYGNLNSRGMYFERHETKVSKIYCIAIYLALAAVNLEANLVTEN